MRRAVGAAAMALLAGCAPGHWTDARHFAVECHVVRGGEPDDAMKGVRNFTLDLEAMRYCDFPGGSVTCWNQGKYVQEVSGGYAWFVNNEILREGVKLDGSAYEMTYVTEPDPPRSLVAACKRVPFKALTWFKPKD